MNSLKSNEGETLADAAHVALLKNDADWPVHQLSTLNELVS
jgi:hypothetical protein